MAPVRTTLRKETPDQIEYGEAILVALRLKAERQVELIAPDQQDNLLVFCRLMLDIRLCAGICKTPRFYWVSAVCGRRANQVSRPWKRVIANVHRPFGPLLH